LTKEGRNKERKKKESPFCSTLVSYGVSRSGELITRFIEAAA
jgi:hypothetical protein